MAKKETGHQNLLPKVNDGIVSNIRVDENRLDSEIKEKMYVETSG
jgi:hypothetical protein